MNDGALLNLRYVAKHILEKPEDTIITMRIDDTTKAVGYAVYDAKATNITIYGENMERKSLTTHFRPFSGIRSLFGGPMDPLWGVTSVRGMSTSVRTLSGTKNNSPRGKN